MVFSGFRTLFRRVQSDFRLQPWRECNGEHLRHINLRAASTSVAKQVESRARDETDGERLARNAPLMGAAFDPGPSPPEVPAAAAAPALPGTNGPQ